MKRDKSGKFPKLDYEFVKTFFETNGCKLLSPQYRNARDKLDYVCSCGNQSSIVFDSFRRGNRCKACGDKQRALSQTLHRDDVEKVLAEYGCVLLGEYYSAQTPIRILCHCGNEFMRRLNNINMRKKCQCEVCALKNRSGENHYEWKPDREAYRLEVKLRFACYHMIHRMVYYFGMKKKVRTHVILGYTPFDLEKRMRKFSNWESIRQVDWDVDHIFPIKAFFDYGISDPKVINSLDNLQPLSVAENIRKSDTYDSKAFESYLKSKGVRYA